MEIAQICTRCLSCTEGHEDGMLYDLAHMDDKTISNLMNESRYSVRGLHDRAWQCARERLEKAGSARETRKAQLQELKERFSRRFLEGLASGGDLDQLLEEYLGDEYHRQLEEELAAMGHQQDGVVAEDMKNGLKEFVEKDLLEISDDGVRITPKGSRTLARYILKRLWDNLSPTNTGTNYTRDEGFGISDGYTNRKHEYGDEFHRIDMEATLLSALQRGKNGVERIEFDQEDLWVRETIEDTKLSIGLMVDESGSMGGDKIHAAIDICLALSEMIRRNTRDRMHLFLFSSQVRELAYWDMLNATFSGGTTDIRGALRRFRTTVAGERADRQVYLITDTEPNCEAGKYIGFEKATIGVIQEAILYQREGITLNVVMVDNTPHLAEFASLLARRNLGRVFFAEPKDLGRVVMEDYLRTRKRRNLKKAI